MDNSKKLKSLLQIERASPEVHIGSKVIWRLPNGSIHRDFGPAIEQQNGTKIWYKDNLIHRDDGPAVITPYGHKEWYKNGERHRLGGPALELPTGEFYYYIENLPYQESEYWWILENKYNYKKTKKL